MISSRKKQDMIISAISLSLCIAHIWQFIIKGFNYNCAMRAGFFASVAVCCILHRNAAYVAAIAGALALMQTDAFNNYSVFWAACIFGRKFPKLRIPVMIVYAADIFIVCELHNRDSSHLFIHFLTCIIYVIFSEDSDRNRIELNLTEEEKKILRQIVFEGRTVDDVDGFSKSSVMRRLREAASRNGCRSNSELRYLYRLSES